MIRWTFSLKLSCFGLKAYGINTKRDVFSGFDLRLQKYFIIAEDLISLKLQQATATADCTGKFTVQTGPQTVLS